MKTKIFIALAIAVTTLAGCSKDNEEKCTGVIEIINNSTNPYDIHLDGKRYNGMYEKTVMRITVESGYHTIKCIQNKGFILYPSEFFFDTNIDCGQTEVMVFP